MIVYLHAVYPGHNIKAVLDAFMSPEIPKRPDHVKELGSITYTDIEGFHVSYLFDVEDSKLGDFFRNQAERATYLGSRAEGINIETKVGLSLAEGVPMALKSIPQ